MARLQRLQARLYGPFERWLRDLGARVEADVELLRRFCDHSGLNDGDARRALAYDTDPLVFVEELQGVKGRFLAAQPDTICIAKRLVTAVDANDGAARVVEATVLHEMVHWAWAGQHRAEEREEGEAFERAAYGALVAPPSAGVPGVDTLGLLSRRWESRNNPGAVGRDSNGGWSYGLYQLSSRQGRVGEFIRFLQRSDDGSTSARAQFAARLVSAGGEPAALAGTTAFQTAWRELAANDDFNRAQHAFIQATHYDPFVESLSRDGFDVPARSRALNDVAWSVSVQHGPGRTVIFRRPWDALGVDTDDGRLIEGIYAERSRVDVYFKSSKPDERRAVLERFREECAAALRMLSA